MASRVQRLAPNAMSFIPDPLYLLPTASPALPHSLEQHDTGRHRHIQAVHRPAHRDRHQPVAALPHQPPQPGPFAPRARWPSAASSRRRRRRSARVARETDGPDTGLLQLLDARARCSRRWRCARGRARRPTPCRRRRRATPRAAPAARRRARRPHRPSAGSRRRCADPRCRRARRAAAPRRGRVDQFAERVVAAAASTSATMPWCTPAARGAIERRGVNALDRHAVLAAPARSPRRSADRCAIRRAVAGRAAARSASSTGLMP